MGLLRQPPPSRLNAVPPSLYKGQALRAKGKPVAVMQSLESLPTRFAKAPPFNKGGFRIRILKEIKYTLLYARQIYSSEMGEYAVLLRRRTSVRWRGINKYFPFMRIKITGYINKKRVTNQTISDSF